MVQDETPATDVHDFLDALPLHLREIVDALRDLVRDAAPETEESVLWNGLSYHVPEKGGRVKGAVCQVTPMSDYVHLGFIHGAFLEDTERLLRGDRKSKRQVPIRSSRDLPRAALHRLIRTAVEYHPGGDG